MTALRRLALAFPLDWSHRRPYRLSGLEEPGHGSYYLSWDGGTGPYGEDFAVAQRDARGVILTFASQVYHPIRIAQYALYRFDAWRESGDERARDEFMIHAQWLRDNQRSDGGIAGTYIFDFAWPKYGAPKGWRSAMAQGEAISVLLRADGLSPGSGFAPAAERAAEPFRREISEGGVVWRERGAAFLEEVANEHAPHVLNGCIFALWGAWELQARTREPWIESLVAQTAHTLRQWLARYDCGWWSLYSLMRSANGHPHIATLKYHAFHIAQLSVLARMFDDEIFAATAERWESYLNDAGSRTRVFAANAVSLYDRARRFDTVAGGAHT